MSKISRFITIVSLILLPVLTHADKNKKQELESKDEFLQNFEEDSKEPDYVYNPKGKKDPFRSFDFSPKQDGKTSGKLTALQKYGYDELKVTAILKGFDDPKAVVEDPQGRGHTVTIGSKIGLLGGTVVKIEEKKVSVLETVIEFTGEKTTRTVELYMR